MESDYQFEQKHEAPVPTLKADMKMINSIGRLALSKSICRFELPMDMRQFKSKLQIKTSLFLPKGNFDFKLNYASNINIY
jgi:hypothetical protein